MTAERPPAVEESSTDGPQQIQVDLRVEAESGVECPLFDGPDDVADARVTTVDDRYVVDIVPADGPDGGTVRRATGAIDDGCPCRVFGQVGCVPHVRAVRGRTLFVTAYVDDRSDVRELVAALRERVGPVTLERLGVVDGPDSADRASVDLGSITAKQREAMEMAVRHGYFEGETTLGEMAEELGISKSALSQRLRTGQAKLVRSIFEESGDGD